MSTKVYRAFSEDYHTWLEAVKLVAEIDCLVSLANASTALGEPAVRPEIIQSSHAFVDFEDLRHPCVLRTDAEFIPNDVKLGNSQKKMILLTGPNVRKIALNSDDADCLVPHRWPESLLFFA